MDLSCSVTQFRIPQRIKMHSEWIEHITLERVSPSTYRAGDMGLSVVSSKTNVYLGRKLTNQIPSSWSQ